MTKTFRPIERTEYLKLVNKIIDFLYEKGLTQIEIANKLKVTDRTVRKWEYFESCPNGQQYASLLKLFVVLGGIVAL